MLTTIWRRLQSCSNHFTKITSRQHKRQRHQLRPFRLCETLERRQFLSANTIGYTGEAVGSLIGTAYLTQDEGATATQATETIVLSDDNSFLSSAGVQSGTIGAEQLPTADLSQGVKTYQVILPVSVEKDGSSLNVNAFTTIQDAYIYEQGNAIDLDLHIYTVETAESSTLLDLSSEQGLSFLHAQLVSALDIATSKLNELTTIENSFVVADAESSVQIAKTEKDLFEMITGWGVTYSDQVSLYSALGQPALSHGSHPDGYDFPLTHNGLVVSESGVLHQAAFGIQVDNSVVYGSRTSQANPLTASNFNQYMLASIASKFVAGVDGVYMPASPSLFETDGIASEFICFSNVKKFEVVSLERPAMQQRVSMDLGHHNVGPMPVTINIDAVDISSTVAGFNDENYTYVISNVTNGKVEKLTGAGWVDVSSPLQSTSPLGLLKSYQLRKIKATDSLRWNQGESNSSSEKSIKLVGWKDDYMSTDNSASHVVSETVVELRGTAGKAENEADVITTAFNQAIKGSNPLALNTGAGAQVSETYTQNGFGVIVRNFNDGQEPAVLWSSQQNFIAASMIHNDLNVPNSVYPAGTQILTDKVDSYLGTWTTPTLVGVYNIDPHVNLGATTSDIWYDEVETQDLSKLTSDTKIINTRDSSKAWSWGVFYPHDANSEARTFPTFKNWEASENAKIYEVGGTSFQAFNVSSSLDLPVGDTEQNNLQWFYDAPGAYSFSTEVASNSFTLAVTPDTDPPNVKYGTNNKFIGNPLAHLKNVDTQTTGNYWGDGPDFGAGAGFHMAYGFFEGRKGIQNSFWNNQNVLNNTRTFSIANSLVSDVYGQVNYGLKDSDYWTSLTNGLSQSIDYFGWHNQVQNFGANWIGDLIVPWANNPKDMINISNALYREPTKVYGGLIPITKYWGWNEVPIPGRLQYSVAKFLEPSGSYIAGTYPNAYAKTNSAINNGNEITLYKGAGTLSGAEGNFVLQNWEDGTTGLALTTGMTMFFDGSQPQGASQIPDNTHITNIVGNSDHSWTITLSENVTLPAETFLRFKGEYPEKLSAFAFALPEYHAPSGPIATSAYKTMADYVKWSKVNSPHLYENIATQLDWYGRQGYLVEGSSVILTMQQSKADLLSTPDANNNNYAKQFITDTWSIFSKDTKYNYEITNGVLTKMAPSP